MLSDISATACLQEAVRNGRAASDFASYELDTLQCRAKATGRKEGRAIGRFERDRLMQLQMEVQLSPKLTNGTSRQAHRTYHVQTCDPCHMTYLKLQPYLVVVFIPLLCGLACHSLRACL